MILEHKGVPVFYSDVGNGDAVVLLHGFLENAAMWDKFIPKFSKSNRIITIDLLGHGKTGCLGYVHTMEMMAQAVLAVLDHLKVKNAIFIGHSMGGYVALAFMDLNPVRITRICLMNSTSAGDSAEKKHMRDRAINAVKLDYKTFIRLSIANLFAPDNREKLATEIQIAKKQALKTPLQGVIAALEGMKIRKDRTQLFRETSIKKMMIIGQRDPVLERDILYKQVLGSEVEIVEFPDGHMSHIENYEDLTYNLIRFIEK